MKTPDANQIHQAYGEDTLRQDFDHAPSIDPSADDEATDFGTEPTNTVSNRAIRLVRFDEIKLGTQRRDLIKGLIPRNGLVLAWGPPKTCKSFQFFDMMMRVALGWEYRGRRVHQGPVVYCAFEGQGGLTLAARLSAKLFSPNTRPLSLCTSSRSRLIWPRNIKT